MPSCITCFKTWIPEYHYTFMRYVCYCHYAFMHSRFWPACVIVFMYTFMLYVFLTCLWYCQYAFALLVSSLNMWLSLRVHVLRVSNPNALLSWCLHVLKVSDPIVSRSLFLHALRVFDLNVLFYLCIPSCSTCISVECDIVIVRSCFTCF